MAAPVSDNAGANDDNESTGGSHAYVPLEPTVSDYAQHLPTRWWPRVDTDPESTWFDWRGHDVHVLRRRRTSAGSASRNAPSVRLVLIHGAGGHSGALWPLASLVPDELADLAAPDLPLYGSTRSSDPRAVRYDDWVELLIDFLAAEDDGRPLVLIGGSLGGMLAYEAAARTDRVAHVIATCLLNARDPRVRSAITRFGLFATAAPLAIPLVTEGIARSSVKMDWVAPLEKMSRSEDLSRLCATDQRGGGVRVPVGFLTSFLQFEPTPGDQMRTPVTLTAPAADTWTPPELSIPWLAGISAPTSLVRLSECGHFPIEEPGLSTLVSTIVAVVSGVADSL